MHRTDRDRVRYALRALSWLTAGIALALAGWGSAPTRAAVPGKSKPTSASMGALGRFAFTDLAGKTYDLQAVGAHKASVFLFVSSQCPISNLYAPRLESLATDYATKGVLAFAVYSNRQEGRAEILRNVKSHGLTFPVIRDDGNALADRLGATYTPEAVVVDSEGTVRYRGRIDDNSVATKVTSHDLADALDAVLAGRPVAHSQLLSIGCAIRRVRPISVATAAGVPTYAHDVASILRAKCEGCHRPGQIAPFSLQDYKQASAWAPDIKRYTQNRQMPPWKPAPGYGEFKNETDINLSDHERAVLAKWADAGAPLGDPKEIPPLRHYSDGWKLGQPDLILQPDRPYHLAADGDDVYRNFVVKTNFTQDMWVQAVEVHPGNRSIVHHVIIYVDGLKLSDKLDGREHDGEPGFTSFGGPGFLPTGMLGGWAPGNDPHLLPDGVGDRVPKDARLVIQVHYHKDGKPETDQTQIGLYFNKTTIDKQSGGEMVLNFMFSIPPGDSHYEADASTTIGEDCHLLNVTPHMHWLGRSMKLWATLPDGTEKPLVWIKDWDFNWQATYVLKQPMELPKGTKVHLMAFYDNSSNNLRNPNRAHLRTVHWGEQTTDEMCIAFLTTTKDSQHLAVQPPAVPTRTADLNVHRLISDK